MEPKPYDQIIFDIDTYMNDFTFAKREWYVGIASDPEDRLFNGHQVDREKGAWIYRKALSSEDARNIEGAYIADGHDGGPGGGDDDSVYVYAFVKLPGTVR